MRVIERSLQPHRGPSSSSLTRLPRRARRELAWMIRRWPRFKDAHRYRSRRAEICAAVSAQLGAGEFIIIGHSLGSVVAADLLTRMRDDQHVRLLITVGSPLGVGDWSATWRTLKPFPFDRIDAWVNVFNVIDAVTGGVGLRTRTRYVVDLPIRFGRWRGVDKPGLLRNHRIGGYMEHPAVALAVAWAHGSEDPNRQSR